MQEICKKYAKIRRKYAKNMPECAQYLSALAKNRQKILRSLTNMQRVQYTLCYSKVISRALLEIVKDVN